MDKDTRYIAATGLLAGAAAVAMVISGMGTFRALREDPTGLSNMSVFVVCAIVTGFLFGVCLERWALRNAGRVVPDPSKLDKGEAA